MDNILNCDKCEFSTSRLSSYSRHLKEKHNIVEPKKKQPREPKLQILNVTEIIKKNPQEQQQDLKDACIGAGIEKEDLQTEIKNEILEKYKETILKQDAVDLKPTHSEIKQEAIATADTQVTLKSYLLTVLQKLDYLQKEMQCIKNENKNLQNKIDCIVSRVAKDFCLEIDK